MSSDLTGSYSGIILNQNATYTGLYNWPIASGGNWIFQTFTFPSDYQRGIDDEARIPDLSGIQVLVLIDDASIELAALNYRVDYYMDNSEGWLPITAGTATGASQNGLMWFDMTFPDSVPISIIQLARQCRFGIQVANGGGFAAVPYVAPTPLLHPATGQGQAYAADGFTPLVGGTACLNFRLLALVGDSGTNFLGNRYRSCVIQASPGNINTTEGANPVIGSGQGTHWMSPPQPSRFAVQSLYFDMRPVAQNPTFGIINRIGNPSFEYDADATAPLWWSSYSSGGTVVQRRISTTWADTGLQSLWLKLTFSGSNQAQGIASQPQAIVPSTPVNFAFAYNLITATASTLTGYIWFYDSTNTLISASTLSTTTNTLGTGSLIVAGTAPANAAYVQWGVAGVSTGAGSFETFIDTMMATFTAAQYPYFDGDSFGYQWVGVRGNSLSIQIIEPTPDDNAIVIDGVIVDPLTPNMAFNVYYSSDDTNTHDNMNEGDWESKLWTRVPQAYICTQRQQYVFPKPILAKHMKLEFTNLQSRSYTPGEFQKPIQYKKFPTWVANYFIMQMELPSFIASHIQVEYDALRFAYDYFLDDLDQAPESPQVPTASVVPQVTNYFTANANVGVDPVTLSKINLVMNKFAVPQGTNVDTSTTLGGVVSNLVNSSNSPPLSAESSVIQPIDYSIVSSLQRESLLFEQTLPVMYFFIPCRHSYKVLSATFDYNRAYFAGVQSVAFLRNNYTIESDANLYIESGGDTANIEISDWIFEAEDNNWYAY